MIAVCMNTYYEGETHLHAALRSYRDQQEPCVLILSALDDDPIAQAVRDVDLVVMDPDHHPGKSWRGSFVQLNLAIDRAAEIGADWFCFASSNDVAYPTKLRRELETIGDANVCYSDFDVLKRGQIATKALPDYDYELHKKGNFVSDCALVRMDIYEKLGPFEVDLNNMAMWDFWMKVHEHAPETIIHNARPEWLYTWRDGAMSSWRNDPELTAQRDRDMRRMLERHHITSS